MGGDATAETTTEPQSTDGGVKINIRCSNGSKFSVQISLDSTVVSFKDVIAQNCDISADQQRLIYKGRILKDDQTLQSYGMNPIFQLFLYLFVFLDSEFCSWCLILCNNWKLKICLCNFLIVLLLILSFFRAFWFIILIYLTYLRMHDNLSST